MGLLPRAAGFTKTLAWKWLLIEEGSGRLIAEQRISLRASAAEYAAFTDLRRYLRWYAIPDRR